MTNFKNVGQWWNDNEIELVEIDGKVYALNGWNGEKYLDSWEVDKDDHTEVINEGIAIEPLYKEVEEEFEIVEYVVE